MANSSIETHKNGFHFKNIRVFPAIENGKINLMRFLDATTDLISLVDQLGSVFSPVKYDMQGNFDKICKYYTYNKDSCLLELMLQEKSQNKNMGAEGVLWLNRALMFFELAFEEIVKYLEKPDCNIDTGMKSIFTTAYDGSVKKYHNWMTQQLFKLICKMSPTLSQLLESLGAKGDIEGFKGRLSNFHSTLHVVRDQIDVFFKTHGFFEQPEENA